MATRRTQALSRDRIVAAAIELLDAAGEGGLTFRALSERLATGPGAIYWHVANKEELLAAATDGVVASAVGAGIREVALGLFTATEEHPWLATQLALQLSRRPWGSVAPRIFEAIGREVEALGVPAGSRFTATSALVHYILGAAGQNAVNTRAPVAVGDREEFLDGVATAWEALDPAEYPFTRAVAAEVRGHDDREQFLGGIELVLAGITAVHGLAPRHPGTGLESGRGRNPGPRRGAGG
ncbi:TetR/AcrR family transcriptional regulator [Amycolatopsis sp. OK19-0408]|uniref:TetR/AcrR family transcriptional regulator n=1 Tax=Amycolatopsis iheyensis TaxID=2945988 RepID=A0A9X2NF37_9PSEU|nr:TetR/AcrR family transcriptional regulator [Amycolatopsis iheyensis]MCR6485702.1 TetR/AcrR family transcriptional regulator [Amycolatopsis iheyensis]